MRSPDVAYGATLTLLYFSSASHPAPNCAVTNCMLRFSAPLLNEEAGTAKRLDVVFSRGAEGDFVGKFLSWSNSAEKPCIEPWVILKSVQLVPAPADALPPHPSLYVFR